MQFTSTRLIACLATFSGDSVTAFGDLPVAPLPQRQRERNMQQRSENPKSWETSRKKTNCRRTAIACVGIPCGRTGNEVQLFHQLVVRQIRKMQTDKRVVERNECDSLLPVEPRDVFDLAGAKQTIAVVNHDVGMREICGRRQV